VDHVKSGAIPSQGWRDIDVSCAIALVDQDIIVGRAADALVDAIQAWRDTTRDSSHHADRVVVHVQLILTASLERPAKAEFLSWLAENTPMLKAIPEIERDDVFYCFEELQQPVPCKGKKDNLSIALKRFCRQLQAYDPDLAQETIARRSKFCGTVLRKLLTV
jgi:hypothetical protein